MTRNLAKDQEIAALRARIVDQEQALAALDAKIFTQEEALVARDLQLAAQAEQIRRLEHNGEVFQRLAFGRG